LRSTPGNLKELNNDILLLSKSLRKYQKHLEQNRAVFLNINTHHENLGKENWEDSVKNVKSLNQYAEAANLMGQKIWVYIYINIYIYIYVYI
jgi:hypothetical protein